jgi:hypothetical protein
MGGIYEVGSGAVIQNSIKIASGIQKLIGRYTHTDRQQGNLISLLLFFSKYGK